MDYKKSKHKRKVFPDSIQGEIHQQLSKIQLNSTNNTSLNKNKGNTSYDSKDDAIPNAHWYDRFNKGLFIVFVRKLGDRNTTKSVSIIEASRLLSKINIKFKEIEYHAWNIIRGRFHSTLFKRQIQRFGTDFCLN